MSRRPKPSEFGFTSGLYVPPAKRRSPWRTVLFSTLLMLVPAVGPGLSTVYVDRRDDPESFNLMQALTTALIQLVAVVVAACLVWLIVVVLLGVRVQISRV